MLESIVAVIAGFVLLAWGADKMVLGASATARNFGVSPLIIGLTIVGFGTSAPGAGGAVDSAFRYGAA